MLTLGVAVAIFWMSRWHSGNGRQQSLFLCSLSAPFVDFRTRGPGRAVSNDFAVNAIHFLKAQSCARGALQQYELWRLPYVMPTGTSGFDRRTERYGGQLNAFYDSQSAFPSYATAPYLDR
jgi:hypothetical protein